MATKSNEMAKPEFLPCGRRANPPPPAPSEEMLEVLKKQLRDYLTSQNLKFTEQRWSIAKAILQTGTHLNAQQIVAKVHLLAPNIGPATVYRSIKVLCDAGLLVKSYQGVDGNTRYELPHDEHHDHIICLDCGEVFEFHNDKIEALQEEAASSMDFKVAGHRHVIHAHCGYFQKK